MGKKKATEPVEDGKTPSGLRKPCECGCATNKTRAKECEQCHKVFAPAAQKSATVKSNGVDIEKEALRFVFDYHADVSKAIKAVEGYSADKIVMFVQTCGGVESAVKALENLKTK